MQIFQHSSIEFIKYVWLFETESYHIESLNMNIISYSSSKENSNTILMVSTFRRISSFNIFEITGILVWTLFINYSTLRIIIIDRLFN